MSIQCIQSQSAEEFLWLNEAHLLKNESLNNLILGRTQSLIQKHGMGEQPLFFYLTHNEQVVGQGIRTHPHKPLIISEMTAAALSVFTRTLKGMGIELTSVRGPHTASPLFAKYWTQHSGKLKQLDLRQAVYEVTDVIMPDHDQGLMILATTAHEPIVFEYVLGFIQDCFPNDPHPQERAREMCDRHLRNQSLFLWKNTHQNIVSMAAVVRESKTASTLSLVYSPPRFRGAGYASRLVASLSQVRLNQGKSRCNLLADLANSTSNSIYQKIGYQKIGELHRYAFC